MSECQSHFSRYPVTGHYGYSGCDCPGSIAPYVVDPMDCDGPTFWEKMPPRAKGEIRNTPYEDLSALYNNIRAPSTRLNNLLEECNVEYDPFDGTFFDLYQGFLDAGGSVEDACYSPAQLYAPGYLPAPIKQKIPADNCECPTPAGTGGGGGSTSGESGGSTSGESGGSTSGESGGSSPSGESGTSSASTNPFYCITMNRFYHTVVTPRPVECPPAEFLITEYECRDQTWIDQNQIFFEVCTIAEGGNFDYKYILDPTPYATQEACIAAPCGG